ncbi:MAG: hypothetical protein U5K54_18860 [Cytophagales bacterium]|nr:hypothetical protein [Cytophagales bacterium]
MKYPKVKLGIALLLSLGLHSLHAQVAVPAAGGNAAGSGGTVSYTVGQAVYTVEGSNGSVAQGVQQPYKISIITGLDDAKEITLRYDAYSQSNQPFSNAESRRF